MKRLRRLGGWRGTALLSCSEARQQRSLPACAFNGKRSRVNQRSKTAVSLTICRRGLCLRERRGRKFQEPEEGASGPGLPELRFKFLCALEDRGFLQYGWEKS